MREPTREITGRNFAHPSIFLLGPALCFIFAATFNAVHAETTPERRVTLGLIFDATGPAAPLGEDCRQGFEVARRVFAPRDEINGRPLTFLFGDSKGDAKTAMLEFSRMTDSEKAVAVLVSRTRLGMAVNPLSRQKAIPLLSSSAHPAFVAENKFAFRIWVRAEAEGQALAKKAMEMGLKRMAILTTEDEYLLSMSQSFSASFEAQGGEIILDEKVDKDFMEFSALTLQLKAKSPDGIFVNVSIPQLSVAYRRMYELGVHKQFFSSYWVFKPDVLEAAGARALEGVIAVEMNFRKPKFFAAVNEIFKHDPLSSMTYSCYFGLAQLLQALAVNKSIETPQEMYRELLKTESVKLLDDPVIFRDREIQVELLYEVLRAGKVEVLK